MVETMAPTMSQNNRVLAARGVVWFVIALPCAIGIRRLFAHLHWPGVEYAVGAIVLSISVVLSWRSDLPRRAMARLLLIYVVGVLILGYVSSAMDRWYHP